MFPVTITLQNHDQLNAALAALSGGTIPAATTKVDKKPAESKAAETAKKSDAATASAGTTTTAAAADAQGTKDKSSETKPIHGSLTPDERNVYVRKAIAAVGRDKVIALLGEFGVAKASEIADPDKLAVFDLKLTKLAGN